MSNECIAIIGVLLGALVGKVVISEIHRHDDGSEHRKNRPKRSPRKRAPAKKKKPHR